MNKFDETYNNLVLDVINNGDWVDNQRTGKTCQVIHGAMAKYDLTDTDEFPILTTKKMAVKSMIGELLGFIRGYDSAAKFRELKCNFWNANANDSKDWLANPNRKGVDDLGRIYGVQARSWVGPDGDSIDQLKIVIDKLNNNIDDRGLIVTHWNPGELNKMALRPCHSLYQFHLINGVLNLSLYQRSCDVPLGIPMNIASYALLLRLVAQITNKEAGIFTHFMGDTHIYDDQYELLSEQVSRVPFDSPKLIINEEIKTLEDLETWVTVDDIKVIDYKHHPEIKFPFAA